MRRSLSRVLCLLCAGLAGACHDSSGGAVSFDTTVTNLIQDGTDETSAPLAVEGTSFVFPTDENAFDDVLPPDAGAVVPR